MVPPVAEGSRRTALLIEAQRGRTARLVRLLWYARPYWRTFVGLSVVSLLLSATTLLQPWPLKLIVDSVLGSAALPWPLTWLAAFLGGS